ncbi:MAG: 30S ribosome-binding factor RbfA [Gemmatimonadota bacterium]
MSPSRSRRTDRVAALILREVTRIVREEVRDPRLGFLTFTGAEVSPDLSTGRVFVSVMGSEQEKHDSVAGLQSAASFIRGQLWDVLDLKTVPELTFHLDRTLEQASRIEALLDRIEESRPAAGTGPPEGEDASAPPRPLDARDDPGG